MRSGLACIGLTTLDVVVRPVDALPQGEGTTLVDGIACAPAGTAAGAALVAAKLGMSVRLLSAVGDDLAGRFVRMALNEAGVDAGSVETIGGAPTSTTVLTVDSAGRRPNFHALGAGMLSRVTPRGTRDVEGARFLHYAGVGGPNLDGGPGAGLAEAASAAGVIVTCDLIAPGPATPDELKRILPYVDYFLPSAVEARQLSGCVDLFEAAAFFRSLGAKACLIKNGAEGSIVVIDDVRAVLPAHDISPIDTTSCGDSYCAGFIAALDRGWRPVDAARFATTTAALVAQGLATLGKLESFEATERAMSELPLQGAPG